MMIFEVKEYALNDTPGQIMGNLTLQVSQKNQSISILK